MLNIDQQFLDDYIRDGKKHPFYSYTVWAATQLKKHAEGDVLELQKLLELDAYPNEPKDIKEYRIKNSRNNTKAVFDKISNLVERITTTSENPISWKESDNYITLLNDSDINFQSYCEKKLPYYKSIRNFCHQNVFRQGVLLDTNGVIVVAPSFVFDGSFEYDTTQYANPFPRFFPSSKVIDYVEDEYAVFETNKKISFKGSSKKYAVVLAIDKQSYYIITPTGFNDVGNLLCEIKSISYKNEVLPAHRIGGKIKLKESICYRSSKNNHTWEKINPDNYDNYYLYENTDVYESYITGIVTWLDQLYVLYSNLIAAYNAHLWLEKETVVEHCKHCGGEGHDKKLPPLPSGAYPICEECNGTGNQNSSSPYGHRLVKPASFDSREIPFPSTTYISKPIEIVTKLEESIHNHTYNAYAVINCEFLSETPLNSSGISKSFDRGEFNKFILKISDIYWGGVVAPIYSDIARIRYNMMGGLTSEQIDEMMPDIYLPTHFDSINEAIITDSIKAAKEAGVDSSLILSLNKDYANSKFENDEYSKNIYSAIIDHNPLSVLTPEQRQNALLDGSAEKVDVVIANYIESFVRRAAVEYDNFFELDFNAQHDILLSYANEKLKNSNIDTPGKQPSFSLIAPTSSTDNNQVDELKMEAS